MKRRNCCGLVTILQQLTWARWHRSGRLLMMPMVLQAHSCDTALSALQQSALGSGAPGTRYARHARRRFSCGRHCPPACAPAPRSTDDGPVPPPRTSRTRHAARSARGAVAASSAIVASVLWGLRLLSALLACCVGVARMPGARYL